MSTDVNIKEIYNDIKTIPTAPYMFDSCPDCGILPDPYPRFNRNNKGFWSSDHHLVMDTKVSAKCLICGWETPKLTTVAECCKYWNEYEFTPSDE